MKERPILFSTPMVQAIQQKRKRQTRRVIKGLEIKGPNPPDTFDFYLGEKWVGAVGMDGRGNGTDLCPYGKPGDRLWVRETWKQGESGVFYRADGHMDVKEWPWRPSIFMPRRASRITLEVTGVRVERVRDISETDAIAEGAMFHDGRPVGHHGWRHDYHDVFPTARDSFFHLFAKINGEDSLTKWVWVVEFRRIA